ncbi:hypothetical protein B0H21DRAFT_527703 [Amylocystis lapponica]|nr:hypothetical protein B0H21DRAFT_527703 [Amylocystis lapponica]
MGSVKLAEAAAQQADDHATPGGTPSHSSPPAPIAPQSRLDRTKWRPLGRPNSSTKIADSSDDKESGDADDLTRLTRELTSLSLNTEGRLQGPSDANAGPVRSDHATRDVSLQPDTPLLTCADSTGACASTRAKSRPLSPDVAEKEDAAVHGLPPNALSEDTSPTAPPSAMSILAKTSRNTPTTSLLAVRSAADHSPTNGSRDACVPAQSRATDDNAVPSPALILAFTSGTPHSRTQSSTMFVPRALHAKARAGSSRTPS